MKGLWCSHLSGLPEVTRPPKYSAQPLTFSQICPPGSVLSNIFRFLSDLLFDSTLWFFFLNQSLFNRCCQALQKVRKVEIGRIDRDSLYNTDDCSYGDLGLVCAVYVLYKHSQVAAIKHLTSWCHSDHAHVVAWDITPTVFAQRDKLIRSCYGIHVDGGLTIQ